MKRIHINNEFTQWAEYLARYFGEVLGIYSKDGNKMWGGSTFSSSLSHCLTLYPIHKDMQVIAFCDTKLLTTKEFEILKTIIPFIESQLDDEGA